MRGVEGEGGRYYERCGRRRWAVLQEALLLVWCAGYAILVIDLCTLAAVDLGALGSYEMTDMLGLDSGLVLALGRLGGLDLKRSKQPGRSGWTRPFQVWRRHFSHRSRIVILTCLDDLAPGVIDPALQFLAYTVRLLHLPPHLVQRVVKPYLHPVAPLRTTFNEGGGWLEQATVPRRYRSINAGRLRLKKWV